MPLYLVETVSIFRHRYVVEAKEEEHATDEVVYNLSDSEFKEFSQQHVDECITSVREIKDEEFESLFDKDNDYLKDWDPKLKREKFINVIGYES
jgi:hypothetical protein